MAWLLVVLGQATNAGAGIVSIFVWLFGGAAVALLWVIWMVFVRRSLPEGRGRWRLTVMPPAALVISVMAVAVHGTRSPLFLARFALSESALTREAKTLLASARDRDVPPRRIGLFHVIRTTVTDEQVRFITASCGVVDSCGVVYAPGGMPRRLQEDEFTPLWNSWWHLFEGF